MNYYNENDLKAAAWLNELIGCGVLPMGYVDTRSIVEVQPEDLVGFTQCHFFTGIGGWSEALRLAGWPETEPVWTGSCPCQPFSCAGKQKGVEDARHLWPEFWRLIAYCEPPVVFGEQVASPAGRDWLDNVSNDLEALDYEVGSADLCAAGAGSPNIRNRLWFVADIGLGGIGLPERGVLIRESEYEGETVHDQSKASGRSTVSCLGDTGSERIRARGRRPGFAGASRELESAEDKRERFWPDAGNGCAVGGVGDTDDPRSQGQYVGRNGGGECAAGTAGMADGLGDTEHAERRAEREIDGDAHRRSGSGRTGDAGGLEHATSDGRQQRRPASGERSIINGSGDGGVARHTGRDGRSPTPESCAGPSVTNGFWRDAGWVLCRPERRGGDPCWRPVEPGTFPLADGVPGRAGLLRGYGNAINPHVAAGFIEAYCEARNIVFDNLDFIR